MSTGQIEQAILEPWETFLLVACYTLLVTGISLLVYWFFEKIISKIHK